MSPNGATPDAAVAWEARIVRVLLRDSGWHAVQPGTFAFDDLHSTDRSGGFSFVEEPACGGHRITGTQAALLAFAEQTTPEEDAQTMEARAAQAKREVEIAFAEAARRRANEHQICPCGADMGLRPRVSWRELVARGCVQVEETQLWHCGPTCPTIGGRALRVLPT